MSYETLTTVISLLSTFRPHHQELVLLNQLNNVFNFDHNIFLIESSADGIYYIDTANQLVPTPKSVFYYKNFPDNVTGLDDLKEVQSKNTLMMVVCGTVTMESNLNILIGLKKIQRFQISMKIGIFFSDYVSSDNLQKLFRWFWDQKIIHVFVAFLSDEGVHHGSNIGPLLNVFTFNPFGSFKVINVTGSESFEMFFLNQNPNFQQDTLRSTVLDDVKMWNSSTHLWKAVCSVLNATLTVVPAKDAREINKLLNDNEIDLLLFLSTVDVSVESYTYPMSMDYFVMLVPESLPYPEFTAYLKTVSSDIFFGYSLITIAGVICFLAMLRYIKHKRFSFFQCVADVLNLLLNDDGSIKYQQLSRAEVFVIVPLSFAGFVIVNGILSTLQSYLTRPIMQPEINTIEEIYNSPFPILSPPGYWVTETINSLTFLSNHSDWIDRVRVVPSSEVKRATHTYNTSIFSGTPHKNALVLLDNQKRLNIRGYRIFSEAYLFQKFISFYTHPEFPFLERSNEILFWIGNAGLWNKWQADEPGIKFNISEMSQETVVQSFPIPMIIFYGWTASGVVFVVEIMWKNITLSKKRRRCLKNKV